MVEAGAYDVLIHPPDIVELRLVLRRANRLHQAEMELRQLRATQTSAHRFDDLVGFSENMQEVFSLARKVAPCDVNVLITGETGTGKSILCRALHRLSPAAAGRLYPFPAPICRNIWWRMSCLGMRKAPSPEP